LEFESAYTNNSNYICARGQKMKIEYLGVIATLMTICSFLIGRLGAFKKNTADDVSCKVNQQRDIKDLQLSISRLEGTMKDLFAQCASKTEIENLKTRLQLLEKNQIP